jgi:glycosyltransferase involved in cell wall biosynthesis
MCVGIADGLRLCTWSFFTGWKPLTTLGDSVRFGQLTCCVMRILIVASERPPIASGVAHCVDNLAQGLRRRGHKVDMLSSADAPYFNSGDVRLSALGGRLLRLAPKIARRYDLVNVHGPTPTISDVSLVLFWAIRRQGGPPVLYTHHWTLEFNGGPLAGLDGAYMAAHQRLARLANHVVVTSDAYADLFDGDRGPAISTVPWGVDFGRFQPAAPSGYDGSRALRVLFVGQLRRYKGAAVAIDAVAHQPRLALTVVGRGSEEGLLRRQLAETGARNVHMTGYLDEAALVDAYRVHDVCVLPSTNRGEAFGLVLLEGMAAGCVPVASDLPGVRELAGPNGLLVTPGDAQDLRWALQALAVRPDTVERLQIRAIEEAAQRSWDSTCVEYENLAERLAGS